MQQIMSAKMKDPEVCQSRNNYFIIINLNIYMLTTLLLLATELEHRFRCTRYERDLGGSRDALQLHQDGDR